jgi:anti-anti-sigma factor
MLRIGRSGPDTLCLSGDLDLASSEQLAAELNRLPSPLRLDVSNVTFMDSTGLRMILRRLNDGPITLRQF